MPRDWFEIVSGLSRERFGSLSQIYALEMGPKMVRDWFEIDSGFSRERLGEVGETIFDKNYLKKHFLFAYIKKKSYLCSEFRLKREIESKITV